MSVKFSQGLILARIMAEREARWTSHPEILPEHFWMVLTRLGEPLDAGDGRKRSSGFPEKIAMSEEIERLRAWFRELGIAPTETRRTVRRLLGKGTGAAVSIHRAKASMSRYKEAAGLARAEGNQTIDVIHLGRAILENPSPPLAAVLPKAGAGGTGPGGNRSDILARFGRDVTAQAAEGRLDPLIGRREELLHLAQVLTQKRKGNAVLVGEAGVGKTCIVEGLARKIVAPDGPPAFRNKRIIEISMAALTAGAAARGSLESRLQKVLEIAEADPDLILFMDEIHLLMVRMGGVDPADIFKPALARGNLKMIGATTTAEYDRNLARDEAIARRFEVIWVEEPGRPAAIEIAAGAKPALEAHHGVVIDSEAIEAAVDLSIRYLPERRLPDKALDLLDQACSQQVVGVLTVPVQPVGNGESWAPAAPNRVARADIAKVIAQRTRIPYEMLAVSDQERVKVLKEYLNCRIIGQTEAMETVHRAVKSAFHGLRDPRRPLCSFLFAGPSGVGKTETAKALAEFLFGGENRLVRIDLSEYTERHQVARLIGSPPGYVGSESPGMLTSAMRHQPASVVLFDEIEKAHPDVLNLLLQILDEGVLTDGQGKKAFFRESVVVLTTNILPPAENRQVIGFGGGAEKTGSAEADRLVEALGRHLRPELLGRLHNIIPFRALTGDALLAIADGVFEKMADRLREQEVHLPDSVREEIRRAIDPKAVHAREVERRVEAAVARWLESRFASEPVQPEPTEAKAEGVLYSAMPQVPSTEMALVVLDLVESTQLVCSSGDTVFSNVIGRIFNRFRSHRTGEHLLFMKCTGDGFLAAYPGVSEAADLALSFLAEGAPIDNRFRIALHWGPVKIGPDGDPLGSEVHRVFRIESVQEGDRADDGDRAEAELPLHDRILASTEAVDRMDPPQRARFRPAGAFRLKGFEDPVALWMALGDSGA